MSETAVPTQPVRTIDGRQVPLAGSWSFDPTHSEIGFSVRHMMVSKVRGSFPEFSGSIQVGEDPTDSSVEISIQAASFSTGAADRDNHITSPEFLDAETYPTITFRSTAVEADGTDWRLTGELTIKDVTRPVVLELEFIGAGIDPWGNTKAGFTASSEIDRTEWGLTWNAALETGGVLVGEKVKIEIDAQTLHQG